MNFQRKSFLLILTVAALVGLAACGSSTPPAVEATTAPTEAPAATSAAGVLPTQAPVTLEGAETTASKLQFLELTPGEGATPKAGDLLTLHFTATLPDGTEFANTRQQSGSPIQLIYLKDQILPGMDEGLGLMKAGGRAKMALPAELAFGAEGYPGMVPANSQVLLEVELIRVSQPPTPPEITEADLTTTASGLKYAELAAGEGEAVTAGDVVRTNYTIWVQGAQDAEYIASSLEGEPLSFVQGAGDAVFPGWDEGMLGMKAGGKRLLIVPPALGMGETGGGGIPANAILLVQVELVEIQKQPKLSRAPESELTTTASGLKYADLVVGEGPAAESGQTVVVHYSGWLEDGTLFDSSVTSGQPFSFTLGAGNVIQGWDEGLVGMKAGGKRQLVIPAELGYGETGAGSTIPGGATLIFEVELIEIK